MSNNKTSSKHLRYQSPIKSPRHAMIRSQQTINDKNLQAKLNQKIRKLKNALQATQAHNQQLHVKLKQHKVMKQEEISSLQQQIKNYKKKLQLFEKEHEQAAEKFKNKANQQPRPGLGKFTSQNKYRQLQLQCKNKDMKVIQLQGVIKDLNLNIKQRQQKIQSLESQIEKKKLQDQLHEQRKLQKIQSQLKTKVVQSFQHNKQILRLKQSLKDSLKKLQKANEKIYEQGEKIKILEQQNKQSRKIVDGMQKQSMGIRQSSQKQKSQLLQKIEQVRKIQKASMEHQFNCKRLRQKLDETTQQHRKLQQQFKSLLVQYQSVSSKYQEVITNQYDLQRDFQKQLHTIVKQLTRRHIVSKSMISSSNNGSRIFTSPAKQQQVRQHEHI